MIHLNLHKSIVMSNENRWASTGLLGCSLLHATLGCYTLPGVAATETHQRTDPGQHWTMLEFSTFTELITPLISSYET